MRTPVAHVLAFTLIFSSALECGGDSKASWMDRDPQQVVADGTSATPSKGLVDLGSRVQTKVSQSDIAFVASIDWQTVDGPTLELDPRWTRVALAVKEELDSNPAILSHLRNVIGVRTAFAGCGGTARQQAWENAKSVVKAGFLGIIGAAACAAVAPAGGLPGVVCVSALAVAVYKVLNNAGCAFAATPSPPTGGYADAAPSTNPALDAPEGTTTSFPQATCNVLARSRNDRCSEYDARVGSDDTVCEKGVQARKLVPSESLARLAQSCEGSFEALGRAVCSQSRIRARRSRGEDVYVELQVERYDARGRRATQKVVQIRSCTSFD